MYLFDRHIINIYQLAVIHHLTMVNKQLIVYLQRFPNKEKEQCGYCSSSVLSFKTYQFVIRIYYTGRVYTNDAVIGVSPF